jgi:hypothetical protein
VGGWGLVVSGGKKSFEKIFDSEMQLSLRLAAVNFDLA